MTLTKLTALTARTGQVWRVTFCEISLPSYRRRVALLSQINDPLLSTELNLPESYLVNTLKEGNVHCSPLIVDWPQPTLHHLQPRHTKCDAWHSWKISRTQANIQKEIYFVQVKCPILLTDLYQTYVTSEPRHRKCDVWLFWKKNSRNEATMEKKRYSVQVKCPSLRPQSKKCTSLTVQECKVWYLIFVRNLSNSSPRYKTRSSFFAKYSDTVAST